MALAVAVAVRVAVGVREAVALAVAVRVGGVVVLGYEASSCLRFISCVLV